MDILPINLRQYFHHWGNFFPFTTPRFWKFIFPFAVFDSRGQPLPFMAYIQVHVYILYKTAAYLLACTIVPHP